MSDFDLMYEIINNILNGCNSKFDADFFINSINDNQLSTTMIKQIQDNKLYLSDISFKDILDKNIIKIKDYINTKKLENLFKDKQIYKYINDCVNDSNKCIDYKNIEYNTNEEYNIYKKLIRYIDEKINEYDKMNKEDDEEDEIENNDDEIKILEDYIKITENNKLHKICPHCNKENPNALIYNICGFKNILEELGCYNDWCGKCGKKMCKEWHRNSLFNETHRAHFNGCCKKYAEENKLNIDEYCECN